MRKVVKLRDNHEYHAYPSVQALIKQEHYPVNQTFMDGSIYKRERGRDWYGVDSWQEVIEALEKGWPEGTAKMRDRLEAVQMPRIPSIKRKRRRDKQGDHLDIHRVYRGDFDRAWDVRKREQSLATSGSHLTIAVDIGVNFNVKASRAMWRGAAAVAIAEAAIESGRQVRMLAVSKTVNHISGTNSSINFSTEVKAYHQRVSTDVLMTMCSLPGFFRVLVFKAYCAMDEEHPVCLSLGTSVNFERDLIADGSKMVWIGNDVMTPEAAQSRINSAVDMMVNRVGDDEYRKTA